MTTIQHVIPIPKPDINNPIRATSKNLMLLLANKNIPIGPAVKENTKESIIRFERSLNQDKISQTPVLSTYEGVVSNEVECRTS